MPGKPEVREITSAQAWPIRQLVMWPDKPLAYVQLPDDATGFHLGVLIEEELVSVVSLFTAGPLGQFRKLATLPPYQKKGLGSLLLEHLFLYALQQGVQEIWCNARLTAAPFYEKLGLEVSGNPFTKDGMEYVKMGKVLPS